MKATVSAHLDHTVTWSHKVSHLFVPGPDNFLKESVSVLRKQLLLSQLLSVQYIGFWKMKNMDF